MIIRNIVTKKTTNLFSTNTVNSVLSNHSSAIRSTASFSQKHIPNLKFSFPTTSTEEVISTRPPLKELPAALRQFVLMRFLQFPKVAKMFADSAVMMIQKGGIWKRIAEETVGPLTKAFSAGDTIPEAVDVALDFLAKDKQILLDYTEEMLDKSEERAAVFIEINKLLDQVSKTQLFYIPIKLTALVEPKLLEKLSKEESLNAAEKLNLEFETQRLYQLVDKAAKLGKVIFIDQEYPHQKKAIFKLAVDLMQRYNRERPVVYITIQATDIECFDLLKQLTEDSSIRFPAIKLVNGAYVNWAHQNGYEKMIQPSKMAAFLAFVLIAKFCLKKGVHLYMGTHNAILEQVVDNIAQPLNIAKNKYLKGQLYGFTTSKNIATMYSIFGPRSSCIHYSLRRVVEGASSHTASLAPILNQQEISAMLDKNKLGEVITKEEIELIAKAAKFNVQDTRVELARNNLYKFMK